MVDYSNIPRDSRRVPLETRVQFKFDRFDGFISEYSANVSPGGMFIRTRAPQPPGTVLDFAFRLGDGFELIRGRGEVVWNRLEDEGPTRPGGMGLRFLELGEGSKELIYRIVDQHVLQGGTPFDVTQRPPDPVPAPAATATPPPFDPAAAPWPRPAPPSPQDVFDLPPPPPPIGVSREAFEAEPAHDTPSWLPSPDEPAASALSEPFPDLLPAGAPAGDPAGDPEPAAAASPPMFATTFGAAAAKRPPRRLLPWALLAAGVLLAAGLFLLRDSVMGWAGLGDEPAAQAAPAPRAKARKPPGLRPAGAAVAVPTASAAAPVAVPPATPEPATPEPAAPKPAPIPAVAEDGGAPLTALDKITFEAAGGGGTDVILWGNGAIPAAVYTRSRIEGNPPRELFRFTGIRQPFAKTRVVVGTPEILQVRIGFHPGAHGNELHVVLDLAHPNVAVTQVEPGPQKLRIHLQRR
ncbi:MAG TPA: TIGR02266 family protein [Thermoanaerobaculia bacterium]|jgi:uncharacterized protein (TIGR02266 family)